MSIGEYIGFVDSDDFIEETMFEKLYTKSKKEDLDIMMCKITVYINETGEINEKHKYRSLQVLNDFHGKVYNHLNTKDFTCSISVTPPNKIYKTEFLKENNIKFPEGLIFEDELFFYDSYLRAKKVSSINENLYYYRMTENSVIRGKDKDFSDILIIFKLTREKIKELGYISIYKKQYYNYFIDSILTRFSQTSDKHKENFYKLMKEDFENIITSKENIEDDDYKLNLNDLKTNLRINVESILKIEDYKEYEITEKINHLKYKNKQLEKEHRKLKKENKKLIKKSKKIKKRQKQILNSKSWKITKPLRKFSNRLK